MREQTRLAGSPITIRDHPDKRNHEDEKSDAARPYDGPASGCLAEVPPPTAAGWAPYAGEVHRTGQNKYTFKSSANGHDTAQSYCKAIGYGFANVLRTGDETAFQCFADDAVLVPTYPNLNVNVH